MGAVDRSRLAKELEPYIAAQVRTALNAALAKAALPTVGGGGSGGGGATPPAYTEPHVLATTSGTGSKHTVSGLTAGQVLRATGATTAAFGQLLHGQLGGIGANDHHAQVHAYDSTDHTGTLSWAKVNKTGSDLADLQTRTPGRLDGTGGAALDVVGWTGTDAIGRLIPSADVSAGASAILRSNAGALGVNVLTAAGTGAKVRTPLIDTASGDLTLSPAGTVKLTSATLLKSDNYASQTTGWGVTYAGGADFRYVYTDELHAKAFIADLEQALAGGQIISKSVAVLHAAFTLPAAGGTAYFVMRDLPSAPGMQVFPNGDIVRFRKFSRAAGSLTIGNAWGTVTLNTGYGTAGFDSATKTQGYRFDRSSAPNAGSATGDMAADAIVLDYGTTGNGFYEVNAIDGAYALNSPYAQTVTWATHPATGQTVRTRTGNLRGIFAIADEYGLYAGGGVTDTDSYLRLSNAAARFNNVGVYMFNGSVNTGLWQPDGTLLLSAANVATAADRALEFVATAGTLRVGKTGTNKANLYWDGTALHLRQNTTPVITLDSDGTSYFAGVMTIGTSGEIRQGTGANTFTPGAGNYTGLRLWRDTNVGRIGGYNEGTLQWYGSTDGKFYAGGGNVILDANGVRSLLTASTNYTTATSYNIYDSTGSSVVAFYGARKVTSTTYLNLGFATAPYMTLRQDPTANTFSVELSSYAAFSYSVDPSGSGLGSLSVTGSAQFGGALDTTTGTTLELKQAGTSILKSDKSASDAYLELGAGRTGDGAAYIDLISDTTYTDYGARLARYTGANGATVFSHRGTGVLRFAANEAAAFQVYTGGGNRFEISATGLVGIGVTPATQQLKVLGSVAVGGDQGGTASYLTLTNVTLAASGAGGGTVKMNGATGRNNAGWKKEYNGTTEIWTPYWTVVTG